MHHFLLKITLVAGQHGGRCPEPKHRVFDGSLTAFTHIFKEIGKVLGVSIVVFGRVEFYLFHGFGYSAFGGILHVVLLFEFLLNVGREREIAIVAVVAGGSREFLLGQNEIVLRELDGTFVANNPGHVADFARVGKVYPQHHLESLVLGGFWVIHDTRHDVGYIAAIFPVGKVSRRENARWPQRVRHEMDTRNEVNEQIAGYARAVVFVVAPPEKPLRIECPFGGITQKTIPVEGCKRGIGWYRVVPGSDGIEAVAVGFDVIDGSDIARLYHSFCLLKRRTANALTTHLHGFARFFPGVNNRLPFVEVLHHRFLTIHVFARFEGRYRDVVVPMIGRNDQHGIYVGAGQNFAVVAGGKQVLALVEGRFGVSQSSVVEVGYGH